MSGAGLLHRDGHPHLRLHPGDVRPGNDDDNDDNDDDDGDVPPVLARRQEQGGGVWRGGRNRGDRGAARQLHDQVGALHFNSMYCQWFNSNVLSIIVKKEIKYVFYLIVTGNKVL